MNYAMRAPAPLFSVKGNGVYTREIPTDTQPLHVQMIDPEHDWSDFAAGSIFAPLDSLLKRLPQGKIGTLVLIHQKLWSLCNAAATEKPLDMMCEGGQHRALFYGQSTPSFQLGAGSRPYNRTPYDLLAFQVSWPGATVVQLVRQ